jgi:5,10-methylenetetrahydromethanopterin reductase
MAAAPARFGIVFLPESLTGFGELCRETEAQGFDWLGVADSQSVFRELYVALALAALHTRRVRLGPLVTNPQTRHLVVTASAIASVDELSGGRAALGLGSGDSAIYTIGAPPATVAGLEDASAAAVPGGCTARGAACRCTSRPRGRARSSWPAAWPTG